MIRLLLALAAALLTAPALAQTWPERVLLRDVEVTVTRQGKPLAHQVLRLPVYPDRKDSYGHAVSYKRRWNEELRLACSDEEMFNEIENEIEFSAEDRYGMTGFRLQWSEQTQGSDRRRQCGSPVKEERRNVTIDTTMRLEPGVEQHLEGEHGIAVVVKQIERAPAGS